MESPERYYNILGLACDAQLAEVKTAFRNLARELHPDKNSEADAGERFKELNNAYAWILKHLESSEDSKKSRQRKHQSGKKFFKVIEHSQCVVVDIGKDRAAAFITACTSHYGPPKNQGRHGLKFSADFKPINNDNTTTPKFGKVHVTVYPSTGNVMAQGACYLLWHAEHLPVLTEDMVKTLESPKLHLLPDMGPGSEHSTDSTDSGHESEEERCCVCSEGNSADMVACDACDNWLHYDCTWLSPSTLLCITKTEEAGYLCWRCSDNTANSYRPVKESRDAECQTESDAGDDATGKPVQERECKVPQSDESINHHGPLLQVIAALEANIIESFQTVQHEKKALLMRKHEAELQSLHDKHQLELSAVIGRHKEEMTLQRATIQTLKSNHDKDSEIAEVQLREVKRQARDLRDDNNKLQEFNRTMLLQMTTLQETVRELTNQNQKLSAQLWSLHRQDPKDGRTDMSPVASHVPNHISDYMQVAPDSVTVAGVISNVAGTDNATTNMGSTTAAAEATNTTEPHNPTSTDTELSQVSRDIPDVSGDIASGQSQMSQDSMSGVDGQPSNKSSTAVGHLVVTSSIGKWLDEKLIAPKSRSGVTIKSISGGTIQSVSDYIASTKAGYKSVSLLVGGNDLDNGTSVDESTAKFTSLVDTVRTCHPGARINVMEVPPRLNNSWFNGQVTDYNQALFDICRAQGNNDCHFQKSNIREIRTMFAKDRIHMSVYGTKTLALAVRQQIYAAEGIQAAWQGPKQAQEARTRYQPNRGPKVSPQNRLPHFLSSMDKLMGKIDLLAERISS